MLPGCRYAEWSSRDQEFEIRIRARRATIGVAVVLIAGACSDDGAVVTTVAAPTTTATSTTVLAEIAPSSTVPVPPDLSELAFRFESTALRTTYAFWDGGEATTVVFSQDPTRVPPARSVIVPDTGSKLITIGNETIFCDIGAEQCFEVTGGMGGSAVGPLGLLMGGPFLGSDVGTSTDVDREIVDIAAREGVCFTFVPPGAAGFGSEPIRQCVDTEFGFTLTIETTNGGSLMELVEFGDPREEDFTPSGPVIESP